MKKTLLARVCAVLLLATSFILVSCHKDTSSPSNNDNYNTPPPAPTNVEAEYESYYERVVVSWDLVPVFADYKVYRSSSYNGYYEYLDEVWCPPYYDYSPLDGDNYYKIKAYNTYGESALSSYAYYDNNSHPNSGVTDHEGHDLSDWELTSAGNYRKTFMANYHVSGNYEAFPSVTDWTHMVTVEYKPKVQKYWLFEPYFNPSSNQGLGLGYDEAHWGYNSIEVHTYTHYDYTYHVLYEAVCFCRFTVN